MSQSQSHASISAMPDAATPLFSLDGVRVETPSDGQYWVAPNATVLGRVKLERNSSVWFNAVLRGDNELILIGEGSNVQDGCVLHTDPGLPMTIGPGCTIGHMAMLHGCTVGANSLIGIGAIVLNGCKIGENCIIGAHTFLAEGKEIPPGSLVVGSPGRVVRQLGETDFANLARMSQSYMRNWQRFKTGLKPQV